jgi:hypothetical protein
MGWGLGVDKSSWLRGWSSLNKNEVFKHLTVLILASTYFVLSHTSYVAMQLVSTQPNLVSTRPEKSPTRPELVSTQLTWMCRCRALAAAVTVLSTWRWMTWKIRLPEISRSSQIQFWHYMERLDSMAGSGPNTAGTGWARALHFGLMILLGK